MGIALFVYNDMALICTIDAHGLNCSMLNVIIRDRVEIQRERESGYLYD